MTNDDREIVHTSVMLPIILQMIDKDDEALKESKQTFRPLFEGATQLLRKVISDDLSAARRELSKRGIRVYDVESGSGSRKWKVVSRGYEETIEILRPTIRADVSERIRKYIEGLFNDVKPVDGNWPLDGRINK